MQYYLRIKIQGTGEYSERGETTMSFRGDWPSKKVQTEKTESRGHKKTSTSDVDQIKPI